MQGPGGIYKGSYDASTLSQDQRQWLFQQFGHSGQVSAGYGGEHVAGDNGQNISVGQNPGSGGGGGGQQQDPLALAKSLQQFQVQANQPAIASLQQRQQDLPTQYKALLDEIKGGQQAQTQFTEGAVNTSLGQRGIDPNSVYGQQQFGSALTPVNQQYGGLMAQVGQGQIQDTNALAESIAQLQRGSPETSISGAGQFAGLAQQAQLIPSQIALQQGQVNQSRYLTIPNIGVYDIQTGKIISSTGLGASGRTIIGVNN